MGQSGAENERREALSQRIAELEQELLQTKAELASLQDSKTESSEWPHAPGLARVSRSLFEVMQDGCNLSEARWDWDVARDEVTFSSRWQEILGYTEHAPVWPAKEWMELVHPDDLRVAIRAVQDHLQGKTPVYQTEMRVRDARGVWRWVLDRGIRIRNEQGAVYRVVGSHTDITERKLAEQELRASQERLQLAQAAAGFGTWEWDLVTGKVMFSESCFALHGIAPQPDFSYTDWLECIAQPDRERIDAEIHGTIRGDGVYDAEFRVRWPDGSIHWLNGRGHAVRDEDGTAIRLMCVSLDVTERRRTEQERQKLAAIIEQSTDLIGLRDATGEPIYLNPSGRRLLGFPAEADARSFSALDYFLAEDREFVERTVFPAVLRDGAWQGEVRCQHQLTGAVVPVAMNMFTVREAGSGELIGLATVSNDISERKRMEDALRKSEQYFRQLAESVPDVVFTSEPDGTVDYFNTRWHTYTGQSEEEARGWGWRDAVHLEDVSRCVDRWNGSLKTGADYEIEYRLRNAYGKYRWFLGRARALRGPDGAIEKWFGSCTDIDQQKFTEQALRRSNEQLQQFAYVASHDLQEPLRTIASFTELLQREREHAAGASTEQYANWVVEAANRMSNLIRDLLAYTLAAGQNEGYREPVAFELLIMSVLELLREETRAKKAHITHDVLPVLTVDRAQFEQVLEHLIGNALKFSKPGEPARIHVSARLEPGAWVFSVEDNGAGFDAVHAEKIFGVFKRLHGRDVTGTGIGLAICKAIIERHGGRIWAESRPGEGSTFWFTLPARSESR